MTILEALKISKIVRRNCWSPTEYLSFETVDGRASFTGSKTWSCPLQSFIADDWCALLPLPPRPEMFIKLGGIEYEQIETPFELPESLGIPNKE